MGQLTQAITAFQEAIKEQPDLTEAHYNLANAYIGQRDYRQALAAYLEAVRLKPDFVQAHTNLGFVYARLRQHEEAAAAFREAIRVKPNFVIKSLIGADEPNVCMPILAPSEPT